MHPVPNAGPRGSVMLVSIESERLSLEAQTKRVAAAEALESQSMTILARVMCDTFGEGKGGTKAEVLGVWRAEADKLGLFKTVSASKSSFYRVWNKSLDLGMIRRVSGCNSYRWILADDR